MKYGIYYAYWEDQWKADYPEAFERAYDEGQGITRDAWVVSK